jgi:hypothetical protein
MVLTYLCTNLMTLPSPVERAGMRPEQLVDYYFISHAFLFSIFLAAQRPRGLHNTLGDEFNALRKNTLQKFITDLHLPE